MGTKSRNAWEWSLSREVGVHRIWIASRIGESRGWSLFDHRIVFQRRQGNQYRFSVAQKDNIATLTDMVRPDIPRVRRRPRGSTRSTGFFLVSAFAPFRSYFFVFSFFFLFWITKAVLYVAARDDSLSPLCRLFGSILGDDDRVNGVTVE